VLLELLRETEGIFITFGSIFLEWKYIVIGLPLWKVCGPYFDNT
jgi:hypothetical protein